MGWCGLDLSKLRALVNAVMNFRVPQNAGKLSRGCTTGGFLMADPRSKNPSMGHGSKCV
jgi:hypothetical protein